MRYKQRTLQVMQKYPFLITILVALLSILAALLIGGILIVLSGKDPILAYRYLGYGVFGNAYGLGEMLSKFIPLLCCGLGFSLANKSGFFNIGAEGQLYAGALASVLVGLCLPSMPAVLHIALGLLAGMLGGAILSAIPGLMKMKLGTNELLVTMMLNYIMTLFINLLVSGPLKNPDGNMEQTALIAESARLPIILPGSRLHAGIFVVLAMTFLLWFLQKRTVPGFEMRLSGINMKAAKYAGVNTQKAFLLAVVLSGALPGLGGALELQGNQYKLLDGLSANSGFDAIGIAVMGQHHPVGIIFSALLFAALRVGANTMQRGVGVPLPIVNILQGIIIICVISGNYFVQRVMDAHVEGRS